jgi:hypothetical protein
MTEKTPNATIKMNRSSLAEKVKKIAHVSKQSNSNPTNRNSAAKYVEKAVDASKKSDGKYKVNSNSESNNSTKIFATSKNTDWIKTKPSSVLMRVRKREEGKRGRREPAASI